MISIPLLIVYLDSKILEIANAHKKQKMFLLKFKHKTNGNLDPKGELDNIFFFPEVCQIQLKQFFKTFFR